MAKKGTKTARPPGRISQLLPDRRTALYLVGGLLLMLAVFFLFTHRMQSQRADVQAQIASAQGQIGTEKTLLNKLQSGQVSPQDTANSVARYDAMLPSSVDPASLAADLPTQALASYNVTVGQMDPQPYVKSSTPGLNYQPFNMTVTGAPDQVAQWLASLQQQPHLMTLENVSYSETANAAPAGTPAASSSSASTAKVTFTLKAWFDTNQALPAGGAAVATPSH